MSLFRYGIMGAGGIAKKFCDAVSLLEDCEVCAVASKSMSRAQEFAKKKILISITIVMKKCWRRRIRCECSSGWYMKLFSEVFAKDSTLHFRMKGGLI